MLTFAVIVWWQDSDGPSSSEKQKSHKRHKIRVRVEQIGSAERHRHHSGKSSDPGDGRSQDGSNKKKNEKREAADKVLNDDSSWAPYIATVWKNEGWIRKNAQVFFTMFFWK